MCPRRRSHSCTSKQAANRGEQAHGWHGTPTEGGTVPKGRPPSSWRPTRSRIRKNSGQRWTSTQIARIPKLRDSATAKWPQRPTCKSLGHKHKAGFARNPSGPRGAFCSAPAERSGDGALDAKRHCHEQPRTSCPLSKSGVAASLCHRTPKGLNAACVESPYHFLFFVAVTNDQGTKRLLPNWDTYHLPPNT